ncbi:NACHT domain-containing protein [Streptomyces sp. NPDC050095]|uniref:NACHT domain-containing protein n=1 Tax=unclassified Streptomyces TaxID=2593676 RepID=UPI00343E7051
MRGHEGALMWDDVDKWLPAIGAFVIGGVLLPKLREGLKKLVDKVAAALYQRLAGSALLARTGLRRYTAAVYERHRRFAVSFRTDESQSMDMASVYVPLRTVVGSGSGTGAPGREADTTLREVRQAVVLGRPGAGKTMLLRHTALDWARRRYDPERPRRTWYDPRRRQRIDLGGPGRITDVPVLLQLHSVDLASADLAGHIVRHFADHDFPRAGRWVERALAEGRLALYFDGLDEVPTAQRPDVVAAIRKFLDVHHRCRAVITCRIAVYDGEFNEDHLRILRVQDFDDRLMHRFLHGWPWPGSLAVDDTVEQLLEALRDTPQLLPLARNPLLLTMIAYLYSYEYAETGQALPHSRADFYDEVVVSLLRDRRRTARFPQATKKAVLERLALAGQCVPSHTYDRLAMPQEQVLDEVRLTLERLGRDAEAAPEVLAEIVERNGMLLPVQHGERYQFAHLSLQEYLAAVALAGRADELLAHYRRDPQVWRETVRLWCGAEARDCSAVVRAILADDPLLAFQCLADAQVVDDALAEEILIRFLGLLGEPSGEFQQADVEAAFGIVAADRRARGTRVFDLLAAEATGPDRRRASAAVRALAATNLPRAARLLAEQLGELPGSVGALASMGDLAVGPLPMSPHHLPRFAQVQEVLWRVRTPRAAERLLYAVKLDDTNADGAFYLADLLREPEIEEALREVPDLVERTVPRHLWVWQPFAGEGHGYLPTVASHIAGRLLTAAEYGAVPPPGVRPDPRIVAALCVVDPQARQGRWLTVEGRQVDAGLLAEVGTFMQWNDPRQLTDSMLSFVIDGLVPRRGFNADLDPPGEAERADLGRRLLAAAGLDATRLTLLGWLPPDMCCRVNQLLAGTGILTRQDWEHAVPEPAAERARTLRGRLFPGLVACGLLTVVTRGIMDLVGTWPDAVQRVLAGAGAGFFAVGMMFGVMDAPFGRIRRRGGLARLVEWSWGLSAPLNVFGLLLGAFGFVPAALGGAATLAVMVPFFAHAMRRSGVDTVQLAQLVRQLEPDLTDRAAPPATAPE